MCRNTFQNFDSRRAVWHYVCFQQWQKQYFGHKDDMIDVRALTCPESDVPREHIIVYDYRQDNHAKAYNYDWAVVLPALYNCARERYAKRAVRVQQLKNFAFNRICETLKKASACVRFECDTSNEKTYLENHPRLLKNDCIDGIICFGKNMVEVLKSQIETCGCAAHI